MDTLVLVNFLSDITGDMPVTIHSVVCRVKLFNINKTLCNLIFPIIVTAGKCTKPINSFIRRWFQISPQLTEKPQDWVHSYQFKTLLLSLKMFYTLLSCFSYWFGTFTSLLK